jgi:hypothetical protein
LDERQSLVGAKTPLKGWEVSKNRVLRCRLFGRPDFSFGRASSFYFSSPATFPTDSMDRRAPAMDPSVDNPPQELSSNLIESRIKEVSLERLSA